MYTLKYKADTSRFKPVAAGLEKRSNNLRPALDDIGLVGVASMTENFDVGGRPTKWPKSFRVKTSGGQTMIRTGVLRKSLTHQVQGKNKVIVGTNDIRGRVHNDGLRITAKTAPFLAFRLADGKFIMTKSVQMKKREFVLWQDKDMRVIEGILFDHVTGN